MPCMNVELWDQISKCMPIAKIRWHNQNYVWNHTRGHVGNQNRCGVCLFTISLERTTQQNGFRFDLICGARSVPFRRQFLFSVFQSSQLLPPRDSHVLAMGAEAEGTPPPQHAAGEPATTARAQPISAAQFLSWKQRKVLPSLPPNKTSPTSFTINF
jgi:hypothetical protein